MTFKGLRYELHYHLAARVTSVLAFSLTGDSGYVSPLYGPVCCSSPATPQVESGRPACVGKESELAKRHGSVTSSAPPVLKHLLSRCRFSVRTKSKMAPGEVGVGGAAWVQMQNAKCSAAIFSLSSRLGNGSLLVGVKGPRAEWKGQPSLWTRRSGQGLWLGACQANRGVFWSPWEGEGGNMEPAWWGTVP